MLTTLPLATSDFQKFRQLYALHSVLWFAKRILFYFYLQQKRGFVHTARFQKVPLENDHSKLTFVRELKAFII